MAKFPPIPPLVQRAPGQAVSLCCFSLFLSNSTTALDQPYARPERQKGMMMPPPPTPIYPHTPLSRGSTQPIPTSYPTQRNTNSELGVAVMSSNGDYYTLMHQANPSFQTRVSAVPLHGVYLVPALPISKSSRKHNSDARQTDAKGVPELSKGKRNTQRTANQ
jgi:hypothetical protein